MFVYGEDNYNQYLENNKKPSMALEGGKNSMIRFLDTEVFSIQKSEVSRSYVRKYFFREGHMDDILVVYDGETYVGYVTYDSFLHMAGSEDGEGYIFREKYVVTPNDDIMWADLKEIFAKEDFKNALLPMFNAQGEMLYLAYDDKENGNQIRQNLIESVLNELEEIEDDILRDFFLAVYSKTRGVRIYNLNEWGYRFYKVMADCGYHMEVWGEKWEVLYPALVSGQGEEDVFVPETAFLNVYAEGTAAACPWNLSERKIKGDVENYWLELLRSISGDFYNWAEERFLRECKGVRFLKVVIPQKKDIIFKKRGEDTCYHCMPEVFETGSAEEIKYCQEVYGRKITKEEWGRLCGGKTAESFCIAGKQLEIQYLGKQARRKIYVVGPCIVMGATVPEEKETFLFCLHKELVNRGKDYAIIGVGVPWLKKIGLYREVLSSLTIQENDMVVSIYTDYGNYTYADGKKLNLTKVYNERNEYWFYNEPIHTNYAGNKAIAKVVAESILSYGEEINGDTEGGYLQIGKRALSPQEHEAVEQYLSQVQDGRHTLDGKRIGAIVMNCNPMTRGHLYLIETARKSVDFLYIFVVEEDRSDIPFADRYAMVCAQTKGMENVCAVPSGKFILSYETMPLYFEKTEKQEAALDATADLQIFCQYIAPRLGIRVRFVGEEPGDKVTRQYNEEMKRMLPYYGMELTEIPRMKQGGEYISASSVRKLAGERDWEAVRELMPQEAYRIYRDNASEVL